VATKKKTSKKSAKADPVEVHERLTAAIPKPRIELDHQNAWQLLIATILSAQSTDRMINRVTPELFKRWPTPRALGEASQEDVEVVVKSTGFFRNKAKAIRAASEAIATRFNGEVPRTMDELVTLPGVARKTANLVLGGAYGIAAGIVVDTHAARVANRLALTAHEDPEKIEAELCEHFPRDRWIAIGQRLILHGRYVCTARAPRCLDCPLNELCPSREAEANDQWKTRAKREQQILDTPA
jgi:endonuclease III